MEKTLDLASAKNQLLLNPRLPGETATLFKEAWLKLVESSMSDQVGIATSGSSGDSFGKLIVLSKKAILCNAQAVNEHFKSHSRDVWLKTLPSFHVGGIGIFARAFLSGAKVVESVAQHWQPEDFYRELGQSGATLLSLVPTQLFDLVQLGLRAPCSLRAVIIGGGRLEKTLHAKSLELGWPSFVSYGFTECASQVATASCAEDERPKVLSHAEIKIIEGDRIAVRSSALLTAQISFTEGGAVLTDPKSDHWFITEDRGALLDDQTLTIAGRTIDFVKIGGEGVLLSRLEGQLEIVRQEFPGIDCAILAAEDGRLGARIVLLSTASEEKTNLIVSQFNRLVLPFERVRKSFRVAEIPRSELGKLLRSQALRLVGLEPVAYG